MSSASSPKVKQFSHLQASGTISQTTDHLFVY